jgi:hypothetical protein
VAATIITPPFTLTARKMGYNTLIDMAQLNIPVPADGARDLGPSSRAHPDVVMAVIRARVEAIHVYKTQKRRASTFSGNIFRPPTARRWRSLSRGEPQGGAGKALPTLAGIQTILDELAVKPPSSRRPSPRTSST